MGHKKIDKNEKENFGFSLYPVYGVSNLIRDFSVATWLGRAVYLMSHLFGAIPHFNMIMAMAKHILLEAASFPRPKPQGDGKLFPQKEVKIQEGAEEEDDIKGFDGAFDWGDPRDPKEDAQEDMLIDDFALAALLQEQDDAEVARKLYNEEHSPFPTNNPRSLSPEDDFAYARMLQARLYEEENNPKTPVLKDELVLLEEAFASPKEEPVFDEEDQAATVQILSTPGLKATTVTGDDGKEPIECMELCREDLRGVAALITKERPKAISPAALKAQREIDLEQYIAFELKRFGHAQELQGVVSLPSGKQMKLEGFLEVFTAPMIISSFQDFAERTTFFNPDSKEWILEHFKQIMFHDYISHKDVENIVATLQTPDFTGPEIMTTGFDIHSALMAWYKGYLLYCDRGSDKIDHGIYVFNIPDPALISEDFLWDRIKREDIKEKQYDIIAILISELNAKMIFHDRMPSQVVGNCAYATMEGTLKTLMAIETIDRNTKSRPGKKLESSDWRAAFRSIDNKFTQWVDFDKQMVLDEFLSEVEEWLSDQGDFGKANLKNTYQEALTCWRYSNTAMHSRSDIKKVDQLLEELGKRP